MKTFRVVVGVLALFPLALLVDSPFLRPAFYTPDALGEMLYTVIGIPRADPQPVGLDGTWVDRVFLLRKGEIASPGAP